MCSTMLCDFCPRIATTHQTDLVNGSVIVTHLCPAHVSRESLQTLATHLKYYHDENLDYDSLIDEMSREWNVAPQDVMTAIGESLKNFGANNP